MLEIRRLGEHIGAEVTGVDVKTMDDATLARIYQAWLDCGVLVVRGQELTAEDYLAYSRRFGTIIPHPSANVPHPEHREITVMGIDKFDAEGKVKMHIYRRGAEAFHTDGNFDEDPYKATQLYCLAVPSRGGDTHFASMYAAYDALPERIKKRLDGVKGVYLYSGRREFNPEYMKSANLKPSTPIRHLLLGTHLETGRKVLFFDRIKIVAIDGMEPAESDAMIEELTGYMIQPNAQYTHKWARGDIVIWDNRSSYHKAAGDYPVEEDRIHWRVSLKEFSSAANATADAY
ncbi:MAG: TauD/TfdA family dioxygenase [Betaproteobacteria bacterium]